MTEKILLIGLFITTLFCLTSCNRENRSKNSIAGVWNVAEKKQFANGEKEFPKYTLWKFSSDGSFLLEGNGAQKGLWKINKDSVLVLIYDSKDTSLTYDSSILETKQGIVYQQFFYKGKRVATSKDGQTEFEQKILTFDVKVLNKDFLKLKNGESELNFVKSTNSESFIQFNIKNILRGLLGILLLILIGYLLSSNRKAISWKLVFYGFLIQIIFALLVFKVPIVKSAFESIAGFFVVVLDFTREGSKFLFGGLLNTESVGFLFAFQVLPTIIFFSALTSLLYYLGVLQKIVYAIAWVMSKTMKLSGAESLSAAANIFLGQTEAPLMVKPFLKNMTRSEMLCIMIGGMATIAGGVLAAYVGFLGGSDPESQKLFATHLLTASILSAPASIVISKILLPETEEVSDKLDMKQEKLGTNVLEAITHGTSDGLKLAINVGAMLLVFTALIAMINYGIRDGLGEWTGWNEDIRRTTGGKIDGLSFQLILGYVFSPFSVLIGIPIDDMIVSGRLLGEKTVLNEFFAYASLAELKNSGVFSNEKSILILTYALCGFSNFASIGIQIGGIGTLAPNQRTTLSQLGIKALIGSTIACFMTASVAGMFFN
ncbi:MAG: Na+ dependent nucleoside transporter [Flavobacteriales bacterium]|nr:Na+ dependent nucleoside transporter [Flavobacteriales bacterium]